MRPAGEVRELAPDLGGIDPEWLLWLDEARHFLTGHWQWFGLLYTALILYLFVVGPQSDARGTVDEDVFFDEDYQGYIPYR